ncbi:MAG: hypothetical protein ABIP07_07895 [Sphingomicrobium sp.]
MFDRHLIGDVAIAFLLAVPTVALSRPQPSIADKPEIASPLADKAAFADRTTVEKLADLPEDRD